jgi:hypothetical protein
MFDPSGLDDPGKPLLDERLRLFRPREIGPDEPWDTELKDDDDCDDVRRGRRLVFEPAGTGGAGRDGVSDEPFQDVMLLVDNLSRLLTCVDDLYYPAWRYEDTQEGAC